MSSEIEKSIYYTLFVLPANYLIYYKFQTKKNTIDSILFGLNYWISNKLFHNIIHDKFQNNINQFLLEGFGHFVLYFSCYRIFFGNFIRTLPNNHLYKTWYVALSWIYLIKYVFNKNVDIMHKFNQKFLKKSNIDINAISDFIDNNFNNIIQFPIDYFSQKFNLDSNNNQSFILDNDAQQFINSLKQMDLEKIETNLNNMMNFINGYSSSLQQVFSNKISTTDDSDVQIAQILTHMIDIVNHNVKTYYFRILIPFCSQTLSLLRTIMNLLWRMLSYPKKWLPDGFVKQVVEMYNDFMYVFNWFFYAFDMANDDISFWEKIIKTMHFIDINLSYYLPFYYTVSTTWKLIEAGMNFRKWIIYLNEFIVETQLFLEKTYQGQKYLKFVNIPAPPLPINQELNIAKELGYDDKNNKEYDDNKDPIFHGNFIGIN